MVNETIRRRRRSGVPIFWSSGSSLLLLLLLLFYLPSDMVTSFSTIGVRTRTTTINHNNGRRTTSSSSSSSIIVKSSLPILRGSSSLNDDGDFLIGGINGDIPTGQNNADYLSSLLGSVDYNLGTTSAGPSPPPSTSTASSSIDSDDDNGGLSTYEQQYGVATTRTRAPDFAMSQPPSPGSLPRPTAQSSSILGLNDDGDFLIDGINDRNSQNSQGGGISLLSALSTSATSASASSSTTTDINLETLLAGSGLMSSSSRQQQQNVYEYEETSSSSGNRSRNGGGSNTIVDYEQVEIIEEFIKELLPSSVSENEIRQYATSLHTQLGFDPDCNSSVEYLQYDDLINPDIGVQMKVLHARYFWNEWTKLVLQQ